MSCCSCCCCCKKEQEEAEKQEINVALTQDLNAGQGTGKLTTGDGKSVALVTVAEGADDDVPADIEAGSGTTAPTGLKTKEEAGGDSGDYSNQRLSISAASAPPRTEELLHRKP